MTRRYVHLPLPVPTMAEAFARLTPRQLEGYRAEFREWEQGLAGDDLAYLATVGELANAEIPDDEWAARCKGCPRPERYGEPA